MGKWLLLWLLLFAFPRLVAQTVKNLPAMQETQVRSLGWEDPLEKGMATHSSILAWRIPWTDPGVAKSRTRLRDYCFLFTFFLSQDESWVSGFWLPDSPHPFLPGLPGTFQAPGAPESTLLDILILLAFVMGPCAQIHLVCFQLGVSWKGCSPGIRAATESWTPSIGPAGWGAGAGTPLPGALPSMYL